MVSVMVSLPLPLELVTKNVPINVMACAQLTTTCVPLTSGLSPPLNRQALPVGTLKFQEEVGFSPLADPVIVMVWLTPTVTSGPASAGGNCVGGAAFHGATPSAMAAMASNRIQARVRTCCAIALFERARRI